jgi:NADH-quinone oxidoreductase subunit E
MSVVKEGFVLEVVQRYEGDSGMLIPMMQDLQAEYGYLPPEELKRLAAELGVPLARVYGVAMFYSSFRLAPRGQHEVTLCMGTVCYLKGSPKISEAICAEYGIKPGGTTADRLFTLQAVNCVGACALAPVMIVDGKYYDGVTADSALQVLRGLAEGAEETPPEKAPAAEPAVRGEAPRLQSAPPAAEALKAAQAPPAAQAPQTAPRSEPKAKPAAKPEPAVEARPKAKPKTAAKPKPKTAAKPKPKTAAKPKAVPKPKAAAKAGPKPVAKKRSRP